MIKTEEKPQKQLIQFQENEPLSFIDSVEAFLYENSFVILLTALGLLIAITVWVSWRV
jgi:hypothetical protein